MNANDGARAAVGTVVSNSWIEGQTRQAWSEHRVRFDPESMSRAQKLANRSPEWLNRMVDAAADERDDLLRSWSANLPAEQRADLERRMIIAAVLNEKLAGVTPTRYRDNGNGGYEQLAE